MKGANEQSSDASFLDIVLKYDVNDIFSSRFFWTNETTSILQL